MALFYGRESLILEDGRAIALLRDAAGARGKV
jgi:hypothetical protein